MKRIGILLLITGLAGCSLDEQALIGRWQAAAFYKNGQNAALDLKEVSIEFNADHSYRFSSLGHYEEKGQFWSSMHYLFFKDTTRQPPLEHVVKVLYLSADSLKIRMMRDSVEEVLFLAKVQPEGK